MTEVIWLLLLVPFAASLGAQKLMGGSPASIS